MRLGRASETRGRRTPLRADPTSTPFQTRLTAFRVNPTATYFPCQTGEGATALEPQRGEITKPRATPWVNGTRTDTQALKGRNNPQSHKYRSLRVIPRAPIGGGFLDVIRWGTGTCVSRPFRAGGKIGGLSRPRPSALVSGSQTNTKPLRSGTILNPTDTGHRRTFRGLAQTPDFWCPRSRRELHFGIIQFGIGRNADIELRVCVSPVSSFPRFPS